MKTITAVALMTMGLAASALAADYKGFVEDQKCSTMASMKGDADCAQCGANWVAWRTPGQLAAGCGGCQRSAPTGGAAYGRPRNSSTPALARPRTAPLAVNASGPPESAAACPPTVPALAAGAAAPRAARVSPATASRVSVRHPVQLLNIDVLPAAVKSTVKYFRGMSATVCP